MWRALSRYFRIENARQAAIPTSEGLSLEPSWMALAINNASLIVGQGMFHVESWKKGEIIKLPAVVLWNQGAIIKLPILPGGRSSEVNDINETGQIVGLSYRYSMNDCRAVLWKEGQVFELPISPLLASDDYTGAADINDRGQILGYGFRLALLWPHGAITDLGDLPIGGHRIWDDGSGTGMPVPV